MKKIKYIALTLCVLCASFAPFAVFASHPGISAVQDSIPQNNPVTADSVVNYAKVFVGVPYVWAGCSSSGFDCSGFVYFVFKRFGYKIERSSDGLDKAGISIPLEEASKGDLIVFTGTDPKDRTVGHVGIVVSEKGQPLHFIHASSSKKHPGVVITDYTNSGYPQRFIGIRRLLHEEGQNK
ncbi:MAG: C40 family peptidase [Bacteroidota bacterium]